MVLLYLLAISLNTSSSSIPFCVMSIAIMPKCCYTVNGRRGIYVDEDHGVRHFVDQIDHHIQRNH